ncbi:Dual specificity protein phosphatase 13 isoform A [Chionoecetes opilio]|uniref:protein-serine/threonine phosphatase n=1 Tax=Chionoecetes opilio TaxID=41210 RepID=A0A8J8W9Q7_CHIOP|nr:Dual specificity protein phosphatase 13 isoform A [Chionoecetes opilio]
MGRRKVQRCNTAELRDLLDPVGSRWYRPVNSFDEVFPGVLLGDADTALSTHEIKDNGITHVLNAAQGTNNHAYSGYVGTNPTYYGKLRNVKFMGIPAMDMPSFYIRPYLRQAADFIDKALKEGGRVFVHCVCGISRSASLVVAFLMLKRGMNVTTAVSTIKKKRNVYPNQGFLSQLCDLDYELRKSGELPAENPDLGLPPITTEREESPIRNLSTYPRFTLVPDRAMDTYTNTKSFVAPRRARSCERYDAPRRSLQDHHPLVEMPQLRQSRSPSPRRLSIAYPTHYEGPDYDVGTKVFDTYGRYARSFAKPISTVSKPSFDPYLSLLREPRTYSYDNYYPLDTDYHTYRYLRAKSPFLPEITAAPTPVYRSYKMVPDRSDVYGSPSYVPAYPYTQRYIPSAVSYPSAYRTTPITRTIWI